MLYSPKIQGSREWARGHNPIESAVAGFFGILLGLSVHEYAHARIARSQGDHTAEQMGRLTLNPLAHIDPIGTIVIPAVLLIGSAAAGRGIVAFGWARPVPVNVLGFRHPRRGILWVSFAGPLSNIALALVAGLMLRAVGLAGSETGSLAGHTNPVVLILSAIAIINLYLAFFNLIPIPPFDGSGVVSAMLPVGLARKYESIGRYGALVVLGVILLGGFFHLAIIESMVVPPALYLFKLFTGA